jgi:glutamate 5-kinase
VRGEADLADVRLGRAGRAGVGTGGMVTKIDAARIATAAGVPVLLTSAGRAGEALSGGPVGTWFRATGRRVPTRLLWLAHAASAHGALGLDAGAVRAVVERRSSLLPAGITSVTGAFVAGDPVDLLDENGHTVARGLVNFDATELPGLLGRSTRDLARELGSAYEREVVHRDDLVVLDRG